jgi:hypothetical protein
MTKKMIRFQKVWIARHLGFDISALPLREIPQTENYKILKRKKVKRRIVVIVRFLAVVLIALVTALVALGFVLLSSSLFEKNNGTLNPNSTIPEVSPAIYNTSKTHSILIRKN